MGNALLEFENIKRLERENEHHFISIPVNADRVFFTDLTDLHVGHYGFDEVALTNFVNVVKNVPNFYVFIGGDSTNHANKGSKSSQFEEYATPREQIKGKYEYGKLVRKGLIQLLEPIQDRIIGIINGNHNGTRLQEFNDMSAAEYYSDLTGVRYFADYAFIEFVVGKDKSHRNSYTHFIHHSGSTGKNKNVGNLMQRGIYFDADVHWGEHTHQDPFARIPVITFDRYNKKPLVRQKLYINGNSYLSWSGYAKAKLYPPNITGAHILEMSGRRGDWDIRHFERVKDFYELVVRQA